MSLLYIYSNYSVTEARPYKKGGSVIEPYCRGLYRRALCSCIHFAYSLRQLYVGILPRNK